MPVLTLVGFDPSLRHWGMSRCLYDLDKESLRVSILELVNPVLPSGKQVRQNSVDLSSAYQLYEASKTFAQGAQAVFVEVPIGSQSARAMASYGVCVGVLGALRASGIPFFEVTPTEVKLAGAGNKNATKQDMIDWAVRTHPEGNWPTYKKNGKVEIVASRAEHMADATGAIHAGTKTLAFRQIMAAAATLR